MKSRPIIFGGEMVRAILDGRKIQTRRVIKPNKHISWMFDGRFSDEYISCSGNLVLLQICPYGFPGGELWVRETWRRGNGGIKYRADRHPDDSEIKWKSPIHLRKIDSRISLRIDKVRVERVQDISDRDVYAEGLPRSVIPGLRYKKQFEGLWDSINEKRGYPWSDNPFVWVIEFEMIEREE